MCVCVCVEHISLCFAVLVILYFFEKHTRYLMPNACFFLIIPTLSLQAVRAETMVDGLLRAVRFRFFGRKHPIFVGNQKSKSLLRHIVSEHLEQFFRPCRGPLAARSRPRMVGTSFVEWLHRKVILGEGNLLDDLAAGDS